MFMRQQRIVPSVLTWRVCTCEHLDLCVEISTINEQMRTKSDYSRLIGTLVRHHMVLECSSEADCTQLLVRVVIKEPSQGF